MKPFLRYALRRFGQFVLVVFVGINLAFFITHATPIDPIEQAIAAASRFSSSDPHAVEMTREALREIYGLQGSLWQQYITFWKRIAVLDFGPSLSAFPTPVTTLVWRALPWTFGLLSISTLISWTLGNLLGGLAGYYRKNRLLKLVGIIATALQPIPNYIMAFIVLILLGYVWPVFPITGSSQINLARGFDWSYISSVIYHGVASARRSSACARWCRTSSPRITSVSPSWAASASAGFSSAMSCATPWGRSSPRSLCRLA